MKFEIVDSLAGLAAYEGPWQMLYRRLPGASVFTSPAWALNWIENFARQRPLRCVFASDTNGLQAVLPLVSVGTRWRRLPLIALTACTNAHSARSCMLVDPASRDTVYAEALATLGRDASWDMLLLDGCDANGVSNTIPPLPGELPIMSWQHSCLHVSGTWDSYLATRSRDLRRNLRRAEVDLAALGRPVFELIESDTERLFAHWSAVDRASWKASDGETVDANAQTTAFYKGVLNRFATQGQLVAGMLSLDGAPVAMVICLRDKTTVYALKTAIRADLSSARLSLGALVIARLLATLWSQPSVLRIDFVSKQSYTERWTRDVLDFQRRVVFAPTWRGRLAGLLDRSYQRILMQTAALG